MKDRGVHAGAEDADPTLRQYTPDEEAPLTFGRRADSQLPHYEEIGNFRLKIGEALIGANLIIGRAESLTIGAGSVAYVARSRALKK